MLLDEDLDQMGRPEAKLLHREADARMRALADEQGLTFSPKGSSFDPSSGTFIYRCELKLKAVGGVPAEEAQFNRYCPLFDLEPSDYGAEVKIKGEPWKLTGLRPNRSKFPYLFTRVSDGKQSLYTGQILPRIKAARGAGASGGAAPPPA